MADQKALHMSPGIPHKGSRPADLNYPRWFGGSASCMAVLLSHPFDLIKVRMQMVPNGAKEGFIRTGFHIIQNEGTRGLYHVTYGTSRIALYEELKLSAKKSDQPLTVPILAIMAAVSGFAGAIIGTPSDIANVRMQNDRSLAVQNRRNYKNVFDAWIQMKRHEGWRAFTQGLWTNCFRSGIMTASQLASYDAFKRLLQSIANTNEERPSIHFSASVLASLVATSISSPMDVIRTQLMSSSQKKSVLNIVRQLTRDEGFRWLFRGWTPSFIRLGPQTIATLVALEQHKRIYRLIKTGRD
ncbi:uncharacterized protein N7484_009127 [Penicillium longicatenatum]|uniref:uncharacterized protein n=1 Tax=Penicillium longicatenatum TaxID=1561947 RepID=UPI0025475B22|nr:uncharacterized protein N7484_009127 [Penicillium longicatenatum]KAJ5635814.1 hypothetical protein N7484_009127 [Penicillium longicatenatum]